MGPQKIVSGTKLIEPDQEYDQLVVVGIFLHPTRGIMLEKMSNGNLRLPGVKVKKTLSTIRGELQIDHELNVLSELLFSYTAKEFFFSTVLHIYSFRKWRFNYKAYLANLDEPESLSKELPEIQFMSKKKILNDHTIVGCHKLIIMDYLLHKSYFDKKARFRFTSIRTF